MTIRPRGNSFMVDVKVRASLNPTGQPLRVRAAFPAFEIARRMETLIRADLMVHGRWERSPADRGLTPPAPSQSTRRRPTRHAPRPRESEDQLKQRRARILRAMGAYPKLVWVAPR